MYRGQKTATENGVNFCVPFILRSFEPTICSICYIFQQDEVLLSESNQGQAIGFWIFCQTLWLKKKKYFKVGVM